MSNKYKSLFKQLISEQEDIPADLASPEDDMAALEAGLDDGTDPSDFEVEPTGLGAQTVVFKKLTTIISKIDEFVDFLNNESTDSVNKFVNEVDKEGSILKGISSETGKISTVAENLAALGEAFRTYILTGTRKEKEKQRAMVDY